MVKETQGLANNQVGSKGTLTNLLNIIFYRVILENLVWHVLWRNPASATTSTGTHQQSAIHKIHPPKTQISTLTQ